MLFEKGGGRGSCDWSIGARRTPYERLEHEAGEEKQPSILSSISWRQRKAVVGAGRERPIWQ
jgi:hypothetical protein